MERPAKRTKLLSDSEDSDNEADIRGSTRANDDATFKINQEYARRFEYNKARDERQHLEAKLELEDDESSTDESEDDDADLITDELDNEMNSALQAIRSKDPRVYNKDFKFYREIEQDGESQPRQAKDAPMTLKDYHRENLLAGYTGEEEAEAEPQTYDQEQDALRRKVVNQMHAAAEDSDDDEDGGFKVKAKSTHESLAPVKRKNITKDDVTNADKDPETFLSNFMSAQAWRGDFRRPDAFDSDDSADEDRADTFEDAYNMRFEDPTKANETLKSFARDSGKYTVRKEGEGGRKKQREREKQKKDELKAERELDRARLRKLKLDEAAEKLNVIKHVAGINGQDVDLEQWRELIEGDFTDEAWDKEMEERFGASYYAEKDTLDEKATEGKAHKPVWDDDIDIKDLVPDFNDAQPEVTLSDEETAVASKKDREKQKRDAQAQRRREQRELEDIVDASLPIAAAQAGGFRYRETSPSSFGLDHRDILFATDQQLNQFAGLKKLAAFRDEERKSRDRKKLGKKARLREWRKEVFGNADGAVGREFDAPGAKENGDATVKHAGTKRKRSRKGKGTKLVEAS